MLSEQNFRLFGNFDQNFGVVSDFFRGKESSYPKGVVYSEGIKAHIQSYCKMPSKSKFVHFANKRAQQKD